MVLRHCRGGAEGRARLSAVRLVVLLAASLLFPRFAGAYPSAEVVGTGGANPPFDLGLTGTFTGFLLLSDGRMAVSYGEVLKLVDLGRYALETDQPPALSVDEGTDGRIGALAYVSASGTILASQEDGDLLLFSLASITAQPQTYVVQADAQLGPIAYDPTNGIAYIADNTNRAVQVFNLSSKQVTSSISLAGVGAAFTITDALFDEITKEAYFSTSVGKIFYIPAGGSAATVITLDDTGKFNLVALDQLPEGEALYVLDATTPSVFRVSTSTHAKTASIPFSGNPTPTDIVIAEVANPTAAYAYVAGQGGTTGAVTVIDTADDEVLDLGSDTDVEGEPLTVSSMPQRLAASSRTDGIVSMGFTSSKLGLLSTNPFVTIGSLTIEGGGSSLGVGGSFTMVFQCDQSGTYAIRAGGTTSADGTLLTDSNGNTSGTLTADTDVTVTIRQADNASAFVEGENEIWVFATANSLEGRRATLLTVDTPPPNVVIDSAGFGNGSIYVNFDRLTAEDMNHYNIYVDTDPDAVLTKSEATSAPAQASSGSTQTAEISGLTNGTVYYIAMEGVDDGGNTSPARTSTFRNGARAFGVPEGTVGPAGLLGEKGCGLALPAGEGSARAALFVLAAVAFLRAARGRSRRRGAIMLLGTLAIVATAAVARADEAIVEKSVPAVGNGRPSPQMWQFEIKGGFWLPQNATLDAFFTKCCNVVTRFEGGALFQKRYGVEAGVGVLYKTAAALGVDTMAASQDRFNFLLIPMSTDFVWRVDYFSWRALVPFVRTGFDYVYFREGDRGGAIQGVKCGMHGGGGLQINIGDLGDIQWEIDQEFGINDLFVTLEGRYQWIDNFGQSGLDLSGGIYSLGLLFEF